MVDASEGKSNVGPAAHLERDEPSDAHVGTWLLTHVIGDPCRHQRYPFCGHSSHFRKILVHNQAVSLYWVLGGENVAKRFQYKLHLFSPKSTRMVSVRVNHSQVGSSTRL